MGGGGGFPSITLVKMSCRMCVSALFTKYVTCRTKQKGIKINSVESKGGIRGGGEASIEFMRDAQITKNK